MLSIRHISKTFNPGTLNAKTAIQDLSLEVADRDFISIVGSNGAGKSSLFNAIAGSFYKVGNCINTIGISVSNNITCQFPSVLNFAIFKKNLFQTFSTISVDKIASREISILIHPHIQNLC